MAHLLTCAPRIARYGSAAVVSSPARWPCGARRGRGAGGLGAKPARGRKGEEEDDEALGEALADRGEQCFEGLCRLAGLCLDLGGILVFQAVGDLLGQAKEVVCPELDGELLQGGEESGVGIRVNAPPPICGEHQVAHVREQVGASSEGGGEGEVGS